jgi:hypothetical protein
LIDLLLKSREKEHIVSEIESFEGKGGKPRESLIRLKEYIMKNDELPEYIR